MIVLSPENFYVVVEARNTLAKDVGGVLLASFSWVD